MNVMTERPTQPSSQATVNRLHAMPFSAMSLFDDMVRPEARVAIKKLYCDVFNSVPTVATPWTLDAVNRRFKELEDRKLPVAVILFDNEGSSRKVAGGFFATISAGVHGPYLSAPDIFIASEYQNNGLATELAFYGREHANSICRKSFADFGQSRDIAVNLSETYKPSGKQFEPSGWYKSLGYEIMPAYHATTNEICNHFGQPNFSGIRLVTFKQYRAEQSGINADNFKRFLTSHSNITSDGNTFSTENANFFVKYLEQYNGTIVRLALNSRNKIVGVIFGEVIPRRTGASLIDLHCAISPEFASQHGERGVSNLTAQLLIEAIRGGNATVEDRHGIVLTEIELSRANYTFFKNNCFSDGNEDSLKESSEFVAMFGNHGEIVSNLREKIVAHNSNHRRPFGLVYPQSLGSTVQLVA